VDLLVRKGIVNGMATIVNAINIKVIQKHSFTNLQRGEGMDSGMLDAAKIYESVRGMNVTKKGTGGLNLYN